MSYLVRFIALIISFHVAYIAFDDATLFSLHPVCMTIGYLLLMIEAIVSLSPQGGLLQVFASMKKTTSHWMLQVAASTLISLGFITVVTVKYQFDAPHFESWHAVLGLTSVFLCGGSNLGGIAAINSQKLKSVLKPAKIKLIHSLLGILITFSCGMLTLLTGFSLQWFTRSAGKTLGLFYSTLVVFLAYVTIASHMSNIYTSKLKKVSNKTK